MVSLGRSTRNKAEQSIVALILNFIKRIPGGLEERYHLPPVSRASLRWTAAGLSVCVWLIGIVMGLRGGHTLGRASAMAVIPAVSGFVAWALYHTISRRNDLLAILFVAIGTAVIQREDISPGHELASRLGMMVILSLVSCFYGLLFRMSPRQKGQKPVSSSLGYDEIDGPFG
jgi:hypothetical protein